MKSPVRVAVTGAAGQISYALLFRIASGEMLGSDQPVILQLLEIPQAMDMLSGVIMELEDCAFPVLHGIESSADPEQGFADADYAILVGAKPRGKGMERADLLRDNGKIFTTQGKALNTSAKKTCKILVVGNPANTNALIAQANAPDIPARNFTAMTRLDHNRAVAQLAAKTDTDVSSIHQVTIWGNHSSTQYPDLHHALVNGQQAMGLIDQSWYEDDFIPQVQQRGAAIINARGASSAASAANAIICHLRDWALGTPANDWVSMAVMSDGSYGLTEGLIYSYPVTCSDGRYTIVQGLEINDLSRQRLQATEQELKQERDAVSNLL